MSKTQARAEFTVVRSSGLKCLGQSLSSCTDKGSTLSSSASLDPDSFTFLGEGSEVAAKSRVSGNGAGDGERVTTSRGISMQLSSSSISLLRSSPMKYERGLDTLNKRRRGEGEE